MNSIKVRISVAALFVMILSNVVIGILSSNTSKKSLEKQMELALAESVHATAEAIFAKNEKEYKMLETLAALPQIRDPQISLLDKTHTIYGAMSLDKDYIDVCITDSEGSCWINNGQKVLPFGDRDYFQVPYKTGSRYVTDPFINRVTDAMAVFYGIPVYDVNGKLDNVIFCCEDGFKLSDITSDHKAGNNRASYLISLRTGLTIASEEHDLVADQNLFDMATETNNKEYIACMNAIRNGDTNISKYTSNGEKYICAYERIKNTDWMAVNTVPYSDFQSDISAMATKVAIYVAIFTLLSVLVVAFVVTFSIKPLDNVKKAINEIATGNADLTKRITSASKDEVGAVVNGFNQFEDKLHGIISDIKNSKEALTTVGAQMNSNAKETTESITAVYTNIENMKDQILTQADSVNLTATAVTEISSNIESLERMIETQASGVSQASSAVEQMIGNISSVNNSVEQMAVSFDSLLNNANSGVTKQEIVSKKIKEIENQSEALQDANHVISKIASQTNLLAMNAAIEAAHAGDAGRGFSVVADEIKKLSDTSARESNKISEQLDQIILSITEVVQASGESTDTFKQLTNLIDSTNEIVRQIKYAMDEQNSGSKQISEALHVMNDNTAEVKQASHEMSIGNQSILSEIQNLQNATNLMKSSMEQIVNSANLINKTGQEMRLIAPQMQISIDDISAQIDKFKV